MGNIEAMDADHPDPVQLRMDAVGVLLQLLEEMGHNDVVKAYCRVAGCESIV